MTPVEVRNLIMVRFNTQFEGQFPIALDNQRFTKPEDPEKWVRLTILFNEGGQETMGKVQNRKFTREGFIYVQVFTVINTGTNENDELCQEALELFDGVRLQEMWMFNGRVVTVGSDGEYYQQNAVLDFKFEEIR